MAEQIFIAECTAYDFKQQVERRKSKSWLKSVSAFANGAGGSLYFGVDDHARVVGLEDAQADAEFVSQAIKSHLDPIPDFSLTPHQIDGKVVLEVSVKSGMQTPYYYYLDGTRTAFIRIGNESIVAEQQQLMALVLKGSHTTYDAQATAVPRSKHSFAILANTFEERTHKPFEEKMLESMGLVTADGMLTQAGLLFADNCPVYQSKLVCTRWTGLHKDNAITDHEYKGNIILLLRYGLEFAKTVTRSGWVKLPDRRRNLPDYEERAVLEALVNHLIHRDYTWMGAEVHMDVYDDRMVLNSPGGMYDGTLIQDRDIYSVPSIRRNPILADVFTQLDYMEKRGSGLKKICEFSAMLDGYKDADRPEFMSEANFFYTTLRNVNYKGAMKSANTGQAAKDVTDKNNVIDKCHKDVINNGDVINKCHKDVIDKDEGDVMDKLLRLIVQSPSITIARMANAVGKNPRTVARYIKDLQEQGKIRRVGPKFGGIWEIV